MDLATVCLDLAKGLLLSVEIFVMTLVISLPLGLGVAFLRKSRFGIVRLLMRLYISIMRGTPLILQLLIVYFGPYYVFGLRISTTWRYVAVMIGFAVNYAAYFAEIYRGGIESMPVGQYEAAKMLGYSKSQTFVRIIFPQVIKRILPAVTNEMITLVKDTSLAFTITVVEMFTVAKQLSAAGTTVMPLFVAGVYYYIFNLVVAVSMEKAEKALAYYR